MADPFHPFALEIASASLLSRHEQQEIARELGSHFYEKSYELRLQGKSEDEIQADVRASFGDPQHIAAEFHQVHRPGERLPIIGPLVGFRPFVRGFKLGVINLIFFVALYLVYLPFLRSTTPIPIWTQALLLICPFVVAFFEGCYLGLQRIGWLDTVKTFAYSTLMLLGAALIVFSEFFVTYMERSPSAASGAPSLIEQVGKVTALDGYMALIAIIYLIVFMAAGLIGRRVWARLVMQSLSTRKVEQATILVWKSSFKLIGIALGLLLLIILVRINLTRSSPVVANTRLANIAWGSQVPYIMIDQRLISPQTGSQVLGYRLYRATGQVVKQGDFEVHRVEVTGKTYITAWEKNGMHLQQLEGDQVKELLLLPNAGQIGGDGSHAVMIGYASPTQLDVTLIEPAPGSDLYLYSWYRVDLTTNQSVLHSQVTKTSGGREGTSSAFNDSQNHFSYTMQWDMPLQQSPSVRLELLHGSNNLMLAMLAFPFSIYQTWESSARYAPITGTGVYANLMLIEGYANGHELRRTDANGRTETVLSWHTTAEELPLVESIADSGKLMIADHNQLMIVDPATRQVAKLTDLPTGAGYELSSFIAK